MTWEFFETMDAYVYVSDVDTYEIIYLNKKARELYSLPNIEDYRGKKCYEALQNCSVPCTLCNGRKLAEGEFKSWLYYNPVINRHLSLYNTLCVEDGRRCRVELAIDLDALEQRRGSSHNYENMEALINEGLRVALRAPTPDQSLEIVLEYLGKALNGERTYIFERNDSGCDDNTYEWTATGVRPEKESLQNLPPEISASWYRNFQENRSIVIEDLESIRESDPLQYETLRRQGIHSLTVVPLFDDQKAIGFYGVDNPPRQALDYTANILQIMGHFIVSSLRRRNLIRELQDMSYRDQLTRIGNRHAMQERVTRIQPEESVGVVYCDVTGLKHVNDTQGHSKGDELLIRACDCLRQAFGDSGLFRMGGDELLALCSPISEASLWERVSALKAAVKENDVVLAVGAVWEADCRKGVWQLVGDAERLMYEDKAAYYRNAKIDRRR